MSYPVCIVRQTKARSVEFNDAKGSYLTTKGFGHDVTSASVNGGTIAITLANGRTELYNARNGSYMRTI